MDAVFFPYNSMFAIDFNTKNTTSAYSVKVDGVNVPITHHMYWKKDFLESSLASFCNYKKNGNLFYMDNYLKQHVFTPINRANFSQRLIANKTMLDRWPSWYLNFAGCQTPAGATIELFQYNLIIENNKCIIRDSFSIYKTTSL
ncbi:MAG: hypothetical protein ABIT58_11475 [Ferruginibacter sp.]